jgi:hypothetical protein
MNAARPRGLSVFPSFDATHAHLTPCNGQFNQNEVHTIAFADKRVGGAMQLYAASSLLTLVSMWLDAQMTLFGYHPCHYVEQTNHPHIHLSRSTAPSVALERGFLYDDTQF